MSAGGKRAAVVAAIALAFVVGVAAGEAWSFGKAFGDLGAQMLKDVFEQSLPDASPRSPCGSVAK